MSAVLLLPNVAATIIGGAALIQAWHNLHHSPTARYVLTAVNFTCMVANLVVILRAVS